MYTSSTLAQLRCGSSGTSVSIRSSLACAGVARRTAVRIVAASLSPQSWMTCINTYASHAGSASTKKSPACNRNRSEACCGLRHLIQHIGHPELGDHVQASRENECTGGQQQRIHGVDSR